MSRLDARFRPFKKVTLKPFMFEILNHVSDCNVWCYRCLLLTPHNDQAHRRQCRLVHHYAGTNSPLDRL
jgi:hypothetical protein